MGLYGYWPMKDCEGTGCTNKVSASSPVSKCPTCIEKEQHAQLAFPDDPEPEQKQRLYEQFLELGFTISEARRLADAWANPQLVSWWLDQGCGFRKAVEIAT